MKLSVLLLSIILPGLSRATGEEAMLTIPGGIFLMGSSGVFQTSSGTQNFPEEAPVRSVTVKSFRIDVTEVTNAQFEDFVKATGYLTYAERPAKREDFPPQARAALPAGNFHQGAVVFSKPASPPANLTWENAYLSWWRWDPTANWRHPEGAGSSIENRLQHPVVCVTYEDAAAYAAWARKRLPTEAEWEYAARGGLSGKTYTWGDELSPGGKWMANTFQGEFPAEDTAEDGYRTTSPAGAYPANGYDLRDMAGNVWEICEDVTRSGSHVLKGGSFLCHVSYCMRYRPAARQFQEAGSPASHTGFRCVRDAATPE